ncbi:MAG TPA: hypothetical protein ENI99_04055 [Sedimenticola sp.]|nr:hypothetical protein [Sedimenticola sp.]
MNSDIRVSTTFPNHPKVVKLQRRLGPQGPLSLIYLWLFVAQNKPDGRLSGMDAEDIEIAAKWDGKDGEFVSALVSLRFIEKEGNVFILHGWEEHNAYASAAKMRKEKAKKAAEARWRKRLGECSEHAEALPQASASTAPTPSPTPSPKEHTPHNPPEGGSGKKKAAVGIQTFLQQCAESGEKPIPPEDKVFEYAASVGIPHEWLHLCWREFVQRNIDSGKRYKDWRRVFRNCVRGNWYKLWWAKPDGEMGLTTQGALARKKHRESAA